MPGKVLGRIQLVSVHHKLLIHQRHEQSGFTPKESTVDPILALRVLTERLCHSRIGVLAAYVDLRQAFKSVNRAVFWRILALLGIHLMLINLISGLYSGTDSAMRCDGIIFRLSLRGNLIKWVRCPFVRPSVRPYVRPSVRPYVRTYIRTYIRTSVR